jgi:hypothetical protein
VLGKDLSTGYDYLGNGPLATGGGPGWTCMISGEVFGHPRGDSWRPTGRNMAAYGQ